MFTMDAPYIPLEETPIVLAQTTAEKQRPQPDYIVSSCTEMEQGMEPDSAMRSVDPAGAVSLYLHRKLSDISGFKPILLTGPLHGTLEYKEFISSGPYNGYRNEIIRFYLYDPAPGFLGKDSATFMVEFEGKHYKVEIEIQVRTNIDQHDNQGCDVTPKVIKVKKPGRGDAGDSVLDWSEFITFSDFSGASLAQTTAAGHGGFIDYTPYLNEEYLLTRSPYAWIARPGPDAEGQRDYAQALDRTANGHVPATPIVFLVKHL